MLPLGSPSNSWDTVSVEYTSISKEVDEFVYTHQVKAGMTLVFGEEGGIMRRYYHFPLVYLWILSKILFVVMRKG